MRAFTTSLVLYATVANAFHKGLNFGANLANGACRSSADWERAFNTMKSLPPAFTSARLFASSDCNTLANAVPAALKTGVKLLIGVWALDENHFSAEKQALLNAISAYPNWEDWLLAASVGSEDLYRGDAPASVIAQKIYDVRGMLNSVGVTVMVGHVDTWTAWVDPGNAAVITATDFVGSDGYPYWQGSTVDQSNGIFMASINDVRDAVNKIKPGLPVWSTETGWPVKGQNFGAAVSSVSNAQAYWKAVACPSFNQMDQFWYAYSETNANPDFSIVDENDQPLYDLSC